VEEEHRINDRIRVPRVLLIDEEGNKLGIFMTRDALDMADEKGLDLVEVAPNARPPVCRIIDYGKMKYEKKKRDTEAKRKRKTVELKEIKVRPKTDGHDLGFKVRHARKFLLEGNKVKLTVRFRGREHAHHDIGAQQCMRIFEEVKEYAIIEIRPRMEGRQMMMIIAPNGKALARAEEPKEDNVPEPEPEAEAEAEAEVEE
jgi:translation initiation factor IF-3